MMGGEIEDTAGLQKPRHESEQRKDDEEEDDDTKDGILEDEPETYGLKVRICLLCTVYAYFMVELFV